NVVLQAENVTVYSIDEPDKRLVDDVSFNVRSGEVLGIAGLMGAGRSELLAAIFGVWQGKHSLKLELDGHPITVKTPRAAIRAGIGFVTEDRKRYGLILE